MDARKEALKKGEAGEWVKTYKGTMNNQSKRYRWEIHEKREGTDQQLIRGKKLPGHEKSEAKKLKHTKYKLKLRIKLVSLEDKMKH